MGIAIKYEMIKNKSDDVDFIQIIDRLYLGREPESIINSCEYSLELDKLELKPELRERFWTWFKKIIYEF